jgi:uncharacterized phage-associated protein
MKALKLSKYIVNNFYNASDDGITPLKLQKLLYYIHVWGIIANQKIIDDKFCKWKNGPVNKSVYNYYKEFGSSKLAPDLSENISLSLTDKKFVDFIASNYVKFSALTLSAMSHQDEPWQITNDNEFISEESIKNFYIKLNFAKNFPIDYNKPFYPVETDLHYSFVLDFNEEFSKKPFHYNSYNEYLELEKKSKEDFENQFKQWLNF